EGHVEANEPAPECRLAQALVQPETERFRKPIRVAGECAEQHTADDHVVEVGHLEEALVNHEVYRGHGQQNAGYPADHERDHEAERPEHWRGIDNPAAKHREKPIKDLYAGGYRDDGRG